LSNCKESLLYKGSYYTRKLLQRWVCTDYIVKNSRYYTVVFFFMILWPLKITRLVRQQTKTAALRCLHFPLKGRLECYVGQDYCSVLCLLLVAAVCSCNTPSSSWVPWRGNRLAKLAWQTYLSLLQYFGITYKRSNLVLN